MVDEAADEVIVIDDDIDELIEPEVLQQLVEVVEVVVHIVNDDENEVTDCLYYIILLLVNIKLLDDVNSSAIDIVYTALHLVEVFVFDNLII